MTEYPIKEAELAEASGISRSLFQKKREELLKPYADFMKIKNALHLTEDAALRVLVALEVSSPANLLEGLLGRSGAKKELLQKIEKNATYLGAMKLLIYRPRPEKSGPIVAVIIKLPLNNRIVDAELESTQKIRVKVKDSRMFVKGQRMPVKKTSGPCWALDAKNPRRKGRIPDFNA